MHLDIEALETIRQELPDEGDVPSSFVKRVDRLLKKYPDRWLLLHLKDLKKGVPTGTLAAKTDLTNDVALGTGQVDWPALLAECQKVGIKYYIIEDESPTVVDQVPHSLRFLEQLEF